MTAKAYLATLTAEAIRHAYDVAGVSFTQDGDIATAKLLQNQAHLARIDVLLTGPTLGRWRSAIGLTGRKVKPEPGPLEKIAAETARPVDTHPQQESLPLQGDLGDVLARIEKHLGQIAGALWYMAKNAAPGHVVSSSEVGEDAEVAA